MAQKVSVVLVDDIDGGNADETLRFGCDGKAYEIDLSTANAGRLRDALAPFVAAGRLNRGASTRERRPTAARGKSTRSADIRAWAADKGIECNTHGRIPHRVIEQYDSEHG